MPPRTPRTPMTRSPRRTGCTRSAWARQAVAAWSGRSTIERAAAWAAASVGRAWLPWEASSARVRGGGPLPEPSAERPVGARCRISPGPARAFGALPKPPWAWVVGLAPAGVRGRQAQWSWKEPSARAWARPKEERKQPALTPEVPIPAWGVPVWAGRPSASEGQPPPASVPTPSPGTGTCRVVGRPQLEPPVQQRWPDRAWTPRRARALAFEPGHRPDGPAGPAQSVWGAVRTPVRLGVRSGRPLQAPRWSI